MHFMSKIENSKYSEVITGVKKTFYGQVLTFYF